MQEQPGLQKAKQQADQLGRSVGDMYKGAFLPGMMLTGFYALYVVILAVFKPHWVPAMPVEARTLREDNGNSGLPSLAILTALCTAAAIYVGKNMPAVHTWWEGELVEKVALDETIVVAMCSGVALAFLAAMFNKGLAGLQFFSGTIAIPGIDRIDIRTGERADETVVGIGKYLTDSVYMEVEQGTTTDSSKVNTGEMVNRMPVKPDPSRGMTEKISRLGITRDTSAESR